MSTLPACDYDAGQRSMTINSYGAICLEVATNQNEVIIDLPTTAEWFRSYWYTIFAVAIIISISFVGIVFQFVRWLRRIANRHEREAHDKRVDGLLLAAARGSMRLQSFISKNPNAGLGAGESSSVRSPSPTTTSSWSSDSDEDRSRGYDSRSHGGSSAWSEAEKNELKNIQRKSSAAVVGTVSSTDRPYITAEQGSHGSPSTHPIKKRHR